MNFTKTAKSFTRKYIGNKTYIDAETGETITFPQFVQEIEGDFNFNKFWLKNYITAMQELANQKMLIAFYLIEHIDYKNEISFTQRELAKATNTSVRTVNATIQKLMADKDENGEKQEPFLVKIRNSFYQVNPNIVFKGSHDNRIGQVTIFKQRTEENKKLEKEMEKTLFDEEESEEQKKIVNN